MCSTTEASWVLLSPRTKYKHPQTQGLTPSEERSVPASAGPMSPAAFGLLPSFRVLPPEEGCTFQSDTVLLGACHMPQRTISDLYGVPTMCLKQSRCLSCIPFLKTLHGEWINRLWYILTMEYYSALKRETSFQAVKRPTRNVNACY